MRTTKGWDHASLPCKPGATPAGRKESIRVALVSPFPSGAGLSRQNPGERHHLFTAPSNINATPGAADLSLGGEGRKRGEVETLQEPPTTSNWSCTNTSVATTPGSLRICSADHGSCSVQRCCKLKPTPVDLDATRAHTWLLNAPLPCVNLATECAIEDLKKLCGFLRAARSPYPKASPSRLLRFPLGAVCIISFEGSRPRIGIQRARGPAGERGELMGGRGELMGGK